MGAQIAPDDIVRRREDVNGGREPLLVLDPLIEFLDAHGLGDGEPEIAPLGDGHSNPTYAVTRGELSASCCAARRDRPIRSPPTTCCARRGCCARCRRPAPACRGCWPSARTSPCSARRSTSPRWSRARSSRCETPPALDTPEQHVADRRRARRRARGDPRRRLARRRAGGLRQAGGLHRAPGAALLRPARGVPQPRDPRARSHDRSGCRATSRSRRRDDDRPRRLPARQRHVRARRRPRAWSPSSTGRWPRSATRSPTSAT